MLLKKDGLRLLTQLISNVYETGVWPKDFNDPIMTALQKKPKTAKCRDHRIMSRTAHTTKIVVRILRRRIESKIEDVLGEICWI
jgi:hypothetical protein